ncbi:mini-circle putative transposase for IS117 [Streptomyces hygroscopicus]|nr:mini-circle putative transposase for IS117 [Streptomyces hygroscopicus]
MRYFAGIDWSDTSGHAVAVIDTHGHVVAEAHIEESPEGVADLLRLLSGVSRRRRSIPVAIETSRGLLVGALRAHGQPVYAINPMSAARYRTRLTPSRKKSDPSDARLLANIIRGDAHLHRALWSPSPQAGAVNTLARAHLDAVRDQRALANRLRSSLREYYPSALSAWAHLPDNVLRPEARAVLTLAPTPARAARLPQRQIATALTAAGRRRQVDDHTARLYAHFRVRTLRQPPAVEAAMGVRTAAILGQLDQACRATNDITTHLADTFAAHPQAATYLSFPGVGTVVGARLLSEIGDDPIRFPTARALRAYATAAPLTWASGTSHSVSRRRLGNKILMATGHHWAFATLTASPGCRAHYDRRRAAGDRHAAALRNLYGRLLGCLHHCLATGQPYAEQHAFPTRGNSGAAPSEDVAGSRG